MSFKAILTHDLLVAYRSRVGKTVLAILGLAPLVGVFVSFLLSSDELTGRFLVLSMWLVVGTLAPLTAVIGTASTISGDRESGRLRLLLGSPTSDAQVLGGTFLSRLIITESALLAGFIIALIAIFGQSLPVGLGRIGGLIVFTLFVTAAYVSLGIAASTVANTQVQSLTLGVVFFVCTVIWPQIATVLGGILGVSSGRTTHFIGTFSPFGAYSQVISDAGAIYGMEPSGPLLKSGVMAVILAIWVIVSIAIGYHQFSITDL